MPKIAHKVKGEGIGDTAVTNSTFVRTSINALSKWKKRTLSKKYEIFDYPQIFIKVQVEVISMIGHGFGVSDFGE
jgi:hypothetical protein